MDDFILGFIAGEGSFSTYTVESDSNKFGLQITPHFNLKVDEREIIEKIHDYMGFGTTLQDNRGMWSWRVAGKSSRQKLISWIEDNATEEFKCTSKWESFKKWRTFTEKRRELMKSRDGIKELIRMSRNINPDKSRSANARTVDELISIVEDAEYYECGEPTQKGTPCKTTVDSPDGTCYRH